MARKKKGTQERPLMDMSGAADHAAEGGVVESFLEEQADEDRRDAKSKHLDTGLNDAKETVAVMKKLADAGQATDADSLKVALLEQMSELADGLANSSRKAVRDAKAEKRNVQD